MRHTKTPANFAQFPSARSRTRAPVQLYVCACISRFESHFGPDKFQAWLRASWCPPKELGRMPFTRKKYNLGGWKDGCPSRRDPMPDGPFTRHFQLSPISRQRRSRLQTSQNTRTIISTPRTETGLKAQGHSTAPAQTLGFTFPKPQAFTTRTSSTLRTYELAWRRKERGGESCQMEYLSR